MFDRPLKPSLETTAILPPSRHLQHQEINKLQLNLSWTISLSRPTESEGLMRTDSFFSSIERTNIEISSLIGIILIHPSTVTRVGSRIWSPIPAIPAIAPMLAQPRNRQFVYLLGAIVAYSLWKWYTLSQNWRRGSHSLPDSDIRVAVFFFI